MPRLGFLLACLAVLVDLDCGSVHRAPVAPVVAPAGIAAVAVEQSGADESGVAPSEADASPLALVGVLHGRRVCLDPGHDAKWTPGAVGRGYSGAVARHPTGIILNEHELTLAVAYRVKDLLEAEGASVCVTRRPAAEGGALQAEPYDFTGDGLVRPGVVQDVVETVQPRIDYANAFGAEVMLSVHFNGSEDRRLRGTEVYYTDAGERREQARALADTVLRALLSEFTAAGFAGFDRGIRSDRYQRYSPEDTRRLFMNNAAAIRRNGFSPEACADCYRLITLGANPMSLSPGRFVAVLVEVEFLSNPDVVEGFILRPDSIDVIARGLARGIIEYFRVE